MIRVLMLDFDDTLVHEGVVFPYVPEALRVISGFRTVSSGPLAMCLVSDFHMPTPPPTEEKINVIFQDFLSILDRFHLREFFEPISERVTLSTHAGVYKPDRKVFDTAINRLGVKADLEECSFISENVGHISACRKLGMSALRFGARGSEGADFSDWSEAPLLITKLVDPDSNANLESALKLYLAKNHDLDLHPLQERTPSKDVPQAQRMNTIQARAMRLYPIADSKLGPLDGVHVEIPVDVVIQLNEKWQIKSVQMREPSAEYISGVKSFLHTLLLNQQVSLTEGKLSSRATHQVELDSKGRRVLKRKRFLAI